MKRKRAFFLLLVILIASSPLVKGAQLLKVNNSQEESSFQPASQKRILTGFSIFFGPVLTNFCLSEKLAEEASQKFRFSFFAGVGYELPLLPAHKLSLEANLIFTPGGTIFDYELAKEKISFNAFLLPLLLKYKLEPESSPFALGGISFGLVLSPKDKVDFVDGEIWEEEIRAEDYNKLIFGLVLGAGYELWRKDFKLFLKAYCHLGLTNLMKEGYQKAKPNFFNLMAGLKF